MSRIIRRSIRVGLIAAGLSLGFLAGGFLHEPAAPAQVVPSSGPSADRVIADINEEFGEMSEGVGGLTAEEKTKLAAMEKKVAEDIRADPSKIETPGFQRSVFAPFRDILNPEHQKKFDAMMAQSRTRALQIKSASTLKMVGMLGLLYANDHQGKVAPDLGALTTVEDATPDQFLAGDSKTTPPANWKSMDAKAKAEWVNKNSDFVYLAGGQKGMPAASNFVMAYIKPEVSPEGNAFLLADGSVHAEKADAAKAIIADLKAGKNPPPALKD